MNLQEIIEWNKNLQSQARELNKRAGQEVFPVMSQSQWKQWLTERINNARNASEIPDLEKIRLPESDPEIVRLIQEENPDQIEILGRMRQVEYPGVGYSPRVKIIFEETEPWEISTRLPIWCGIPDEGYKLPGGRQINLCFTKGYYDFVSGKNGKEVKDIILADFNSAQFRDWWAGGDTPSIHVPDPVNHADQMPEITTVEYGRCVVHGTPLVAFGVVAFTYSSSTELKLKSTWCQTRSEAENTMATAIECLDKFRREQRKKCALASIIIPDPSRENAVIPEIAEIEGGYGVVIVDIYRSSYGSDPWFKIHWTQSREDAEKHRENAVKKLEEVMAVEIRKRKLSEAKAEAEKVKAMASELRSHKDCDRLAPDLSDKLRNVAYGCYSSGLEEGISWIAEAKKICVEAKTRYAEIQRKREERGDVKIPDSLISAYNGNEDKAYDFMQKVASLRTVELDEHTVCGCGRERVRSHLVQVSGDDEFFLGADPNEVKGYVRRVHYYGENFGIPLASSVKKTEVISPEDLKAPTVDALAALRNKWGRK